MVILPLTQIELKDRSALLDQAQRIFFETALVKSFPSPASKADFLARWFGNYVAHCPDDFYIAVSATGPVLGYLAGCLDSFADTARPVLKAIPIYTPQFCTALSDYPSHLHINVDPEHHRRGIGRRLIERFSQRCAEDGSSGIHLATGSASPSVKFYAACGFAHYYPAAPENPSLAVMVRPAA
jgi:GNAT superfamily N-acetyltransferase